MWRTKSISDDDLCSDCKQCQYKPGDMSKCTQNFPGKKDSDGYFYTCTEFIPIDEEGENFAF